MWRIVWGLSLAFATSAFGQNQHGALDSSQLPFPTSAPFLGTTVSVNELRIPKKASKELRLAQRFFELGNSRESATHLEKAIRIYPGIPSAHYNLGVCYAHFGEYEKAAKEFQATSALDSGLVQPAISLSVVFFLVERYSEAEAAAHRAQLIDPASPAPRYMLARILAAEGHNTPEVMALLRDSRSDFPAARLVLAGSLLKCNATEEAVAELSAYLAEPHAPGKDQIACVIEKLTKPGGTSTCSLE